MAVVSSLPSANSRKRASASREEEVESHSATSTVYPLTPFKANKVMMHFWLAVDLFLFVSAFYTCPNMTVVLKIITWIDRTGQISCDIRNLTCHGGKG